MIKKFLLFIILFLLSAINVNAEWIEEERYIKEIVLFESNNISINNYHIKEYLPCGTKVYVHSCNDYWCDIDIKYNSYEYNLAGEIERSKLTDEVPNCSSSVGSSGSTRSGGTSGGSSVISNIFSTTNSLDGKRNIGVCAGKVVHSDYCDYSGIGFSAGGRLYSLTGGYSDGYFMGKGYEAEIGGNSYNRAFCLDPALPAPKMSLTKVREINLSVDYDKQLYSMYQQFIENSQSSGDFENNTAYFQYALRLLTIKFGYDYISSESTYKNDGTVFMGCAKNIDNNIISNDRLNKLELDTSLMDNYSKDSICFGSSEHKTKISELYSSSTNGLLWENPLATSDFIDVEEILPSDANPNYTYKFKLNFSNFWDKGNSISQLGLSEANFIAYISVNGTACKVTGDCDAAAYTAQSYLGRAHQGDAVPQQIEFTISFTPEQYQNYFGGGSGTISLNYQYNHPLDISNIFIARENATEQTYQRMVVINNFIHNNSHTINIGYVEPKRECEHNFESNFINRDSLSTNLSGFLESCGCDYVNYNILTNSEKEIYKNEGCIAYVEKEEPFGGIKACNISSEQEPIGYKTVKKVNNYCSETCVETIDINNLKNSFSTKAGTYFEFNDNEYPKLTATKKCTVNIDYNLFNSDYRTNLNNLAIKYNNYKLYSNVSGNQGSCCEPTDSGNGCKKYNYSYYSTYNELSVVNDVQLRSNSVTKFLGTYCGGKSFSGELTNAYDAFLSAVSSNGGSITNLQDAMRSCNNQLFKDSNNTDFYKFKQDLKFYYEQTYSKSNEIVLNNERNDKFGIDDSTFVTNDYESNVIGDDNKTSATKPYYSITMFGSKYDNILYYTDTGYLPEITRRVEYNVFYKPEKKKAVNSHTGKIEDITGLTNYNKNILIELGNGYDTDISAVAKENNNFYYRFSKLGENNKLFDYFDIQSDGRDDSYINRYCTYETTNEVVKACKDGECSSNTDIIDPTMNLVYRIVDPANIDPHNRLGGIEGFKNWNNDKGKSIIAKLEKDASTNSVFSPDNLEYSFELDSVKIKDIRENINKGNKYSDFVDYVCTDGNECESEFVYNYAKKDEYDRLVGNGRDKWKNWMKNSSTGKCYIDSVEVPCS